MSESFDPYLKWFGIPPRDRPVHHYRLLAIEVFEADAEVIENAADQRMAHLKRFNTGKHSALAEKLLNEVAAARVCLLNPAKKAKYDEELRQRLAGQASGGAGGRGNARCGSPARGRVPARRSFLTQFETVPSRPQRPVARCATKKTKTQTPWAVILAVVAGLAAVVLIAVLTSAPKGDGSGPLPTRSPVQRGTDGQDHRRHPPKRELGDKGADHGAEKAVAARGGRDRKQAARWAGGRPRRCIPPRAGRRRLLPPARQRVVDRIGAACGEAGGCSRGHRQSAGGRPREARGTVAAGSAGGAASSRGGRTARPSSPTRRARRRRRGRKRFRPPMRRPQKRRSRSCTTATSGTLPTPTRTKRSCGWPTAWCATPTTCAGIRRPGWSCCNRPSAWPAMPARLGKAGEILDKIGQSYDINVVAIKVDMVQNRADELTKAVAAPGRQGPATAAAPAGQPGIARRLPDD